MDDKRRRPGAVTFKLGSGVGAWITGVAGLLGGFVATGNGDFVGGGLFLMASALAFGLLALTKART
ncbi:MAG: hypothetical protein AAGD06_24930 [Acidobacteriota bacterium]